LNELKNNCLLTNDFDLGILSNPMIELEEKNFVPPPLKKLKEMKMNDSKLMSNTEDI